MDNHGATNASHIGNQKEFKMEVISLKNKIQEKIESIALRVKIQEAKPSEETVTSLGVLKIHDYKLKEILERLEDMDKTEWIKHKADLLKDYKAAHDAFNPQIIK